MQGETRVHTSLTSNPHLSLGGVGRCAGSRPSGRSCAVKNCDRVCYVFGREWSFSPTPLCGVRTLLPSRRGSLDKRTHVRFALSGASDSAPEGVQELSRFAVRRVELFLLALL